MHMCRIKRHKLFIFRKSSTSQYGLPRVRLRNSDNNKSFYKLAIISKVDASHNLLLRLILFWEFLNKQILPASLCITCPLSCNTSKINQMFHPCLEFWYRPSFFSIGRKLQNSYLSMLIWKSQFTVALVDIMSRDCILIICILIL